MRIRTPITSERGRWRSLQQAQLLALLHHRHITRLYGTYEDATHAYLVMEKVGGGELFDALQVTP
jgi:serine/threonine protein kinase